MRAFIYTGGEICAAGITERPEQGDLVIAADAGYRAAKTFGVKPDILLGDFDSLGEPKAENGVEILRVPAEKDFTDTQFAVQTAIERGADFLTIVGGLSGRLDHTLSNLAILEELESKHLHGIITDGWNRAHFIRNNSTLVARSEQFAYLSILAADPLLRGVTIEGCKYPLKNAKIKKTNQFAVSNEITGNCAFIAIRRGGAWIVESAK